MNKFIIENRTNANDVTVLNLVKEIVTQGRISNNGKQFCYGTAIQLGAGTKYMVWTDLNKRSDRFVITYFYDNCRCT
jgi:hypothetical protein